ncbi:MAG: hypothetical protein HN396_18465 [Gemmatimonadales bacterium]|jgi:hypothetical protein|nr:hypothetical protein [Gemmatimonadales bacterium]
MKDRSRNLAPEVRVSLVVSVPDPVVSSLRPGDLYISAYPRGSGLPSQCAVVPAWQVSDLYPSIESNSPFYVSYLQVGSHLAVHVDVEIRELFTTPLYLSRAGDDGKRHVLNAPKEPGSCGILDVERGGKDPFVQLWVNDHRKLCLILEVEQYRLLVGVASAAAAVAPDEE